MINVLYDPETITLRLTGHAGSAEAGKDLVCAGASALICALAGACEGHQADGRIASVESKLLPGDALVHVKPTKDAPDLARLVVESFVFGFQMLAESYPEYVRFHQI